MFTGRNILPGMPEDLKKVLCLLNAKADLGEFAFSDSFTDWERQGRALRLSLNGYVIRNCYFAVSLAYIAHLNDGNLAFPQEVNVWPWAASLRLLASVANWEPAFMKNVIQSFSGRQDQVGDFLENSVLVYSKVDFGRGMALLAEMPHYKESVWAGLMENDYDRFCETFPPEQSRDEFAEAFSKASLDKDSTIKAYDRTGFFESFTSPSAMAFFLTAHDRLEGDRKKACELKIRNLLEKGETDAFVTPVSVWISQQNDNTEFWKECALLLVARLSNNTCSYLKELDSAISIRNAPSEFLVELAIVVVDCLSPKELLNMSVCLQQLSEDKNEFPKFVHRLVLHPKGGHREVGRQLWDDFHLEDYLFNAADDLEENLQFLFILSMLCDLKNPKARLRKVLPLLKSESKDVRAFLVNQLLPYMNNYMGLVVNVMDDLGINGEEASSIRQYVEERAAAIRSRRALKELSPSYIYGREYGEAKRVQNDYLQELKKEVDEKHKPLWKQMMKSVVLARNGGVRDENGKTIRLALNQVSIPVPVMMSAMSPMESQEWQRLISLDWNDSAGNR